MNPLENFSPHTLEKKKEVKRGKVLRALTAAAVMAIGGVSGYGVSKDVEKDHKEKENVTTTVQIEDMNPDQLFTYFESEGDVTSKVNYAATIILDEINKNPSYQNGVALNSGNNVLGGNPRLDITRDFLTKFMNAHSGGKFHGIWGEIIKSGVYTRENLFEILRVITK